MKQNLKKNVFILLFSIFCTINAQAQETDTLSENKCNNKVTFQGYANFVCIAGSDLAGPGFDVSLGARICDIAYMGFETGFAYAFDLGYRGGIWAIPLGVNFKVYLPTGTKIYPFLDTTIGVLASGDACPFHCQLMPGCDFGNFTIAAGWDRIGYQGENIDLFAIKLGIRFGK